MSEKKTLVELAQSVEDLAKLIKKRQDSIGYFQRSLVTEERQLEEAIASYAAAKKALRDALPPDPDSDAHSAFAPEYEVRMASKERIPIDDWDEPLDDMIRNS